MSSLCAHSLHSLFSVLLRAGRWHRMMAFETLPVRGPTRRGGRSQLLLRERRLGHLGRSRLGAKGAVAGTLGVASSTRRGRLCTQLRHSRRLALISARRGRLRTQLRHSRRLALISARPKEGAPREIEIEREIVTRSSLPFLEAAALHTCMAAMHSVVRCRRRRRQQVVVDRGGMCWDQRHVVAGRVNKGAFGVGVAVATVGGQMIVPSLVEVLFCDEASNHMQYVHMQSARNRVHSACNQHAIKMQSLARLMYYSLSIHSTCKHNSITCNHMQSETHPNLASLSRRGRGASERRQRT